MNDDDRILLASAYLDGEISPDERATVEGDPAVMSEVDRLRSLRMLLADADAAPISVREQHLAAALDTWDRIPDAERTGVRRDVTPVGVDAAAVAAAASVSAPPGRPGRRRGPSTIWMTAAAAGLVAVLAGGVLLQLTIGDDDSDDASAVPLADSVPVEEATVADAADADASDAAAAAEAAGTEFADGALESEIAADGGELSTGVEDAAPPADTDLAVLLSGDDLAEFAADALDAISVQRSPNVPAATSAPVGDEGPDTQTGRAIRRCPGIDIVVGPALYGNTEVIVGIDESRDLAIASTMADCVEIARAPLP